MFWKSKKNNTESAPSTPAATQESAPVQAADPPAAAQDSAPAPEPVASEPEKHSIPEPEPLYGKGEMSGIKGDVIDALRTVFDPEIPVNIYDIGLIYNIDHDESSGELGIRMTLTSPNCPEAETIPLRVEQACMGVSGVSHTIVDIVWQPPWTPDKMSEAAKLEMGLL